MMVPCGAQAAHCRGEGRRPAAALEDEVRAGVGRPVSPRGGAPAPYRFRPVVRDRRQTQALGGAQTLRVRVGKRDLGGTAAQGEQPGQQPDDTSAGHQNLSVAHSVGELHCLGVRRSRPDQLGRGVQQAVGADRPHLIDVDAEQRVQPRREHAHDAGHRISHVAAAVAVVQRYKVTDGDGGRAGLDDPADLHVAERLDRVAVAGLAFHEHPALGVPGRAQVGVRALDERQLGARRQPRVDRVDPELVVLRWLLVVGEEIWPARASDPSVRTVRCSDINLPRHLYHQSSMRTGRPSAAERRTPVVTR